MVSERSSTRIFVKMRTIPIQTNVPTTAMAIVIPIPASCARNRCTSPNTSPSQRAALLIDDFPNNPVAIPPQIPPIPWHPNASNASSIFSFCLISFTPKKQIGLTNAPMINADQIGTKPAPGVIATRPTTRPVEAG